jgi:hypothetical protein
MYVPIVETLADFLVTIIGRFTNSNHKGPTKISWPALQGTLYQG